MRYTKDHKELSRERIIDASARAFRRNGIVATGVATLMNDAGMTNGAFYSHFASKDALIEATVDRSLEGTLANVGDRIAEAKAAGVDPLGAVIDAYLSENHLQSRDISCALASLGSELGCQADAVQSTAYRRITEISAVLEAELPESVRYRAGPLFAMLAATLQIAWLTPSHEAQMEILEAGRRSARDLIAR